MFLSPAEKLLALRKKYKITQAELVGTDVTRVFLGMIEIGKRSLTEKTAKLLCKNFDRILKERGQENTIDIKELMKSREQQAIEYLNIFLNEEVTCLDESIWNIEEALYEINEVDRTKFCLQLFDKFVSLKEYKIARNYLFKSMHRLRKVEEIESRLVNLFKMNDILEDYQKTILSYKKFEDRLPTEKISNNLEQILFYYAKALIKTKKYENGFYILRFLLKKTKEDNLIFEIRKLTAHGYWEMKDYENAAREFTSFVKGRSINDKVEAYAHVIDIAIESEDELLLKKLYDKCKMHYELETIEDERINFEVLTALGRGAKALGKDKDSKAFFMEALMVGKSNNYSVEKRMDIIAELFQIFEKSDFFSVQSIENEYFSLLEQQKDYRPGIKILEYYYKTLPGDIEKKFKMFK